MKLKFTENEFGGMQAMKNSKLQDEGKEKSKSKEKSKDYSKQREQKREWN